MVKMYNALPNEVKEENYFSKFVNLLKKDVHLKRFYCLDEFLVNNM
jgi:hypothetical protein